MALLRAKFLTSPLTVFADFKYTRSFFDGAGAATGFFPDPFKQTNGTAFSPDGISVPIANPFNPFTHPGCDSARWYTCHRRS